MKLLSEITKPDQLLKLGFTRHEEDTADTVRSVWYRKAFDSIDSNVKIEVEVEFELSISDDPYASYTDNLDYFWNGCFIRVIDRQMDRLSNQDFDEETERPRSVGRLRLKMHTLEELKKFVATF